ncbi:hypothetical protein KNE206_74550 [Kitasatospora sp. NE20-6]|uniref:hypothetical protein n=1 Tax=Kitasatospora sp. NE20-6 TaxID=2859066 RepID=UPI0034DBB840
MAPEDEAGRPLRPDRVLPDEHTTAYRSPGPPSGRLEADGRVDRPALPAETVFEDEQLGRRVVAQRAGFPELDQEQQELPAALGIDASTPSFAVTATDRFLPTGILPARGLTCRPDRAPAHPPPPPGLAPARSSGLS